MIIYAINYGLGVVGSEMAMNFYDAPIPGGPLTTL